MRGWVSLSESFALGHSGVVKGGQLEQRWKVLFFFFIFFIIYNFKTIIKSN